MRSNVAFLATDVGRLFRKRFDLVSRNFGVTGPQWRVLVAIERTPGINQGALAGLLEVEAITVGRMIDRLEKLDMVERRPDPADRRAWRLYITPAAAPLMAKLMECGAEVFAEALAGFNDADHAQLLELLQRVRANLIDEIPAEVKMVHG